MRRIALIVILLVGSVASLAAVAGADGTRTYKIEMFNAFGIVEGSDIRISGVNAGSVTDIDVNERKRAVATAELSGPLSELGEDTVCNTDPQSLIAEYFIDCEPKGPALPDGGTIPAEQVEQTVQSDLAQNTLREPFARRLQLLLNEFGTALAGNPEDLNTAIRQGAPALTETEKALRILAQQNEIIRDLNANSDTVIGELNARRDDVVRAIKEIRDTSRASAERREDLSRDFELLDDFLAELRPTLAQLGEFAREQTPLLGDLRAAGPGLARLSRNLPPFNDASRVSLESLGDASGVGRRALRKGADEIEELAEAGRGATTTTEMLADLLRDLDDPRRAVEIDARVAKDTGRTNKTPETKTTQGYTGMEGLLNYIYYQTGSLNQFNRIGHSLHVSLYEEGTGKCGGFETFRDPETGKPFVPAKEGPDLDPSELGAEKTFKRAANCVGWLGPNQPGITEPMDLPPYDPAVCPQGTSPDAAKELCFNPEAEGASAGSRSDRQTKAETKRRSGKQGLDSIAPAPGVENARKLEELLDLPKADRIPREVREALEGSSPKRPSRDAVRDLLDFMFGP